MRGWGLGTRLQFDLSGHTVQYVDGKWVLTINTLHCMNQTTQGRMVIWLSYGVMWPVSVLWTQSYLHAHSVHACTQTHAHTHTHTHTHSRMHIRIGCIPCEFCLLLLCFFFNPLPRFVDPLLSPPFMSSSYLPSPSSQFNLHIPFSPFVCACTYIGDSQKPSIPSLPWLKNS